LKGDGQVTGGGKRKGKEETEMSKDSTLFQDLGRREQKKKNEI